MEELKRKPTFGAACLPLLFMAVVLGVGFGIYRCSVEVLLLVCSFATVVLARFYSTKWDEVATSVSDKIAKSFMAIFIFVFIGMIIGTWMLSGTIPMLIYYGLKLLSPRMFYLSAFLITAVVSICTGTSFGSAGTVGLALMGVAQGLGVNLAIAAGAVVSGAYFGDKLSPLSDTTNLAPVAAGTTLWKHIGSMLYTSIPAAIVCVVVYFALGMMIGQGSADISKAQEIMNGLSTAFHFNILLLLPLIIVLIGSAMGKPTIPVMFVACICAGALAIFFQRATLQNVVAASFNGFKFTMLPAVDASILPESVPALVERGGMMSMMQTLLKVLCAFLFAGAMTAGGFMNAILEKLKTFIHSDGTLILISLICTVIVGVVVGNAYIPILICGELFQDAFAERGLAPQVLSRTLEDSGTVVIPLVPWSAGGAYMAGALGVATSAYAPWALFCWSGMIFAVILGFAGIGMIKLPAVQQKTAKA